MLRDTTSRGLFVRVWPPHTSERRGGGGGCEQEGWQGGEARGRARMSGQTRSSWTIEFARKRRKSGPTCRGQERGAHELQRRREPA